MKNKKTLSNRLEEWFISFPLVAFIILVALTFLIGAMIYTDIMYTNLNEMENPLQNEALDPEIVEAIKKYCIIRYQVLLRSLVSMISCISVIVTACVIGVQNEKRLSRYFEKTKERNRYEK